MRNAVFWLSVFLAAHSTLCLPLLDSNVTSDTLSAPSAVPSEKRFLSPYGFGMGMPFLPPAMPYASPYASPYMSGYTMPYQLPMPAYSPSAYNMASPLLPS